MPRYVAVGIMVGLCGLISVASGADRIGYQQKGPKDSMDMGQDFVNIHRYNKTDKSHGNSYSQSGYSESLGDGLEIRMVWMPSGAFWMGISNREYLSGSDRWLHAVKLNRSFYIQEKNVSELEFRYLLGKSGIQTDSFRPAIKGISWYDTIAFCNLVSVNKNLDPCYYSDPDHLKVYNVSDALSAHPVFWKESANGYRLPTEAEWEYSMRMNAEGGRQEIKPVPIEDGWEWCWDWYGRFPSHIVINPKGPDSGQFRVLKGGKIQHSKKVHLSKRSSLGPMVEDRMVSFRIARFAD
ncbi:SUMF1/EgtB/PvdO family nonheme iron enzyme [bacterium]|nr:SUMF1/EgtB/PvdO family nonheme iron enzyme [candidate division CSSED10-310 bacterium]